MEIDWKRKLTSRKLWAAVACFVSGLMVYLGHPESEAQQIGGLILQAAAVLSYCIGEGIADSGTYLESYTMTDLEEKEEE